MIRRLVEKTSALACLVILLCFAYAGLFPFRAPPNGASWLSGENGIHIGGEGVLWSDRPIAPNESPQSGCSIELSFQADFNRGASTILDFYRVNPLRQLIVREYGNSRLQILQSEESDFSLLEIEHSFFPGHRTLLTISSGAGATSVYLDGLLIKTSRQVQILNSDCSGQLTLGAAAISYNNWNGTLYGLAIYHSILTESQVQRHYDAWTTQAESTLLATDNTAAIYLFDERSGSIVHNQFKKNPDLLIPQRFRIPGHPLLESPWALIRSSEIGWKDVTINVVGFIPFGFFLFSFLLATPSGRHPAVATIVLGAGVSLTIEFLQWYLPTRDSSTIDVVTNVLGTALGVGLHRFLFGDSSKTISTVNDERQ
jgi:VanZ like family